MSFFTSKVLVTNMSASLVSDISIIQFICSFIRYMCYPAQQHKKNHNYALYQTLKDFVVGIIVHGVLNLFYAYVVLSWNQGYYRWMIDAFWVIILFDIIIIITHLSNLRDGLLCDLGCFLSNHPYFVYNGYKNLYLWLCEYAAYNNYYSQFGDYKFDCSICKEPWNQNDPRTLLFCGHVYHETCIELAERAQDSYSKTRYGRKCPLCRDLYDTNWNKHTLDENYYIKQGILFYPVPRNIANVALNGYKVIPNKMYNYGRNTGSFIQNTAMRMMA